MRHRTIFLASATLATIGFALVTSACSAPEGGETSESSQSALGPIGVGPHCRGAPTPTFTATVVQVVVNPAQPEDSPYESLVEINGQGFFHNGDCFTDVGGDTVSVAYTPVSYGSPLGPTQTLTAVSSSWVPGEPLPDGGPVPLGTLYVPFEAACTNQAVTEEYQVTITDETSGVVANGGVTLDVPSVGCAP